MGILGRGDGGVSGVGPYLIGLMLMFSWKCVAPKMKRNATLYGL